jgi:Family of unknown function (DUF6496)
MAKKKYSAKAKRAISASMREQKGTRRPRKQKIAIALAKARRRGLKVPRKRKG